MKHILNLCTDELRSIGEFAINSKKDLLAHTSICKKIHTLFKDERDQLLTNAFLNSVGKADWFKVKEILEKSPELIFNKGKLIDFSGREFNNISALQYSKWAMDSRMFQLIIEACRHLNDKKDKFELLNQQLKEIDKNGLTHNLNGNLIEGITHFDLPLYIDILKKYLSIKNIKEQEEYWIKIIGGFQRLFPAHIVKEFCEFWKFRRFRKNVNFNFDEVDIREMDFVFNNPNTEWKIQNTGNNIPLNMFILSTPFVKPIILDEKLEKFTPTSDDIWYPLSNKKGIGIDCAVKGYTGCSSKNGSDYQVEQDIKLLTQLYETRKKEIASMSGDLHLWSSSENVSSCFIL